MGGEVTQILSAIGAGDPRGSDALLPLVYDELRRLAAAKLRRERPGQTLNATALVHEAYLRLTGDEGGAWSGRGHFFAAAAEAMRRILIERARAKLAEKRGGGRVYEPLHNDLAAAQDESVNLLATHEALERFELIDPAKAALVKLRYFVGLSEEQAAEALGISRATAARHWSYARAWLYDDVTNRQHQE